MRNYKMAKYSRKGLIKFYSRYNPNTRPLSKVGENHCPITYAMSRELSPGDAVDIDPWFVEKIDELSPIYVKHNRLMGWNNLTARQILHVARTAPKADF